MDFRIGDFLHYHPNCGPCKYLSPLSSGSNGRSLLIGQIHDCDLLEKRKSFYLMHERQQGKKTNNQTAKTLKKHDSYDI